jgi:hypothetical protein
MRPINEAHVAQHGLAVVEIAACDDPTAFAVQELLTARCAIAPTERTTRDPGGRRTAASSILAGCAALAAAVLFFHMTISRTRWGALADPGP